MKPGTPGFNKNRLREAREARGLTVTALAEMVEVSKQAISQYEKGSQTPRPEILEKLSVCLNFQKNFFLKPSIVFDEAPIFYRSLSAATKSARLRAESKFIWLKEITAEITKYIDLPPVNVPDFQVKDVFSLSADDIDDLAKKTRRHWGLGDGPISNLTTLLENNGFVVSRLDLDVSSLDALSQFSSDRRPYIFLSTLKSSCARSRFDLAHELAHIVFHRGVLKNSCSNIRDFSLIEKQAHRFASSFLMPEKTFTADLSALTLDAFWLLKERWQTSIASMIKRCEDIGIIDDDYYRKLWINYSRRGWTKREPLDDKMSVEQPQMLKRCFDILVKENIFSRDDLLYRFPYPISIMEEIMNLPFGSLTGKEKVEVLPVLKNNVRTSHHVLHDSNVIPVDFKKKG